MGTAVSNLSGVKCSYHLNKRPELHFATSLLLFHAFLSVDLSFFSAPPPWTFCSKWVPVNRFFPAHSITTVQSPVLWDTFTTMSNTFNYFLPIFEQGLLYELWHLTDPPDLSGKFFLTISCSLLMPAIKNESSHTSSWFHVLTAGINIFQWDQHSSYRLRAFLHFWWRGVHQVPWQSFS